MAFYICIDNWIFPQCSLMFYSIPRVSFVCLDLPFLQSNKWPFVTVDELLRCLGEDTFDERTSRGRSCLWFFSWIQRTRRAQSCKSYITAPFDGPFYVFCGHIYSSMPKRNYLSNYQHVSVEQMQREQTPSAPLCSTKSTITLLHWWVYKKSFELIHIGHVHRHAKSCDGLNPPRQRTGKQAWTEAAVSITACPVFRCSQVKPLWEGSLPRLWDMFTPC